MYAMRNSIQARSPPETNANGIVLGILYIRFIIQVRAFLFNAIA